MQAMRANEDVCTFVGCDACWERSLSVATTLDLPSLLLGLMSYHRLCSNNLLLNVIYS